MRGRVFAASLGVAATACLIVAYINRSPGIEGAYFSSEEGELQRSLFDPFDPWDGYLWLGAGIALALAALAVLVLERFARPS